MYKSLKYFSITAITLLLLSGCIHRELIISGPDSSPQYNNPTTVKRSPNTNRVKVSRVDTPPSTVTMIPRVPFPDGEYSTLSKTGNGTIKGSIYITDAYGKKVYGKQTRLYLNPVTSYSKQWYQESYIGGYKMAKADKRLFNYLKFTASNAQGKFAFYGVPSGSYYVIGMVKCGKECGYDAPRNIRIAKEVSISSNEVITADLSKMID